MRIRPITDIEKLQELYEKSGLKYEFDPRNFLVAAEVVNDNGEIVGAGYIKVFAEAVIVFDSDKDNMSKAWALTTLIHHVKRFLRKTSVQQLHVFADDIFAQKLTKHFGFETIPQKALVLEVSNG